MNEALELLTHEDALAADLHSSDHLDARAADDPGDTECRFQQLGPNRRHPHPPDWLPVEEIVLDEAERRTTWLAYQASSKALGEGNTGNYPVYSIACFPLLLV